VRHRQRAGVIEERMSLSGCHHAEQYRGPRRSARGQRADRRGERLAGAPGGRYGEAVDTMTCPQCGSEMTQKRRGNVDVAQCSECAGIFLARAHLSELAESEISWHESHQGHHTQPLPRISESMTAPPEPKATSRSYMDTLFS
jgi:Zn-finger nucleic acid-binding protein